MDAVATYYGINKNTFKHRIQKAKESQLIDYKIIKVGKEVTIVVNAKVNKLVRIWTTADSSAAKKSIKLAEKAKREADIEEKNSHQENNTDDSLAELEKLLDYDAKHLSDSQVYVGCILSSVKDRLQEMIEMKGEDYAVSYMNKHWPKIDLCKVL